jgi:hypothetical protein
MLADRVVLGWVVAAPMLAGWWLARFGLDGGSRCGFLAWWSLAWVAASPLTLWDGI